MVCAIFMLSNLFSGFIGVKIVHKRIEDAPMLHLIYVEKSILCRLHRQRKYLRLISGQDSFFTNVLINVLLPAGCLDKWRPDRAFFTVPFFRIEFEE